MAALQGRSHYFPKKEHCCPIAVFSLLKAMWISQNDIWKNVLWTDYIKVRLFRVNKKGCVSDDQLIQAYCNNFIYRSIYL